jgi:poly-gamma-glutamate synthesis protein (capsule biosynthesis protein)
MIFAGDVAIAAGHTFEFKGFSKNILRKPWCINLEGAVADKSSAPAWGCYNCKQWHNSFARFNLGPVFAANNHIHDINSGILLSIQALSKCDLTMFGAGSDTETARQPQRVTSNRESYLLLGFGWPIIGCKRASAKAAGVNKLEGKEVRKQAKAALASAGNDRVVVIIHGNYEFERYPQPAHRKLAFQLIDFGIHAVVFHHPHIVGPIERYKGKTIAYSLGNWAFSYGEFFGGKLCFPESSFHQVALELGTESDTVHHAIFSPPATVSYDHSEEVDAVKFSLKPAFEGFTHIAYMRWFQRNRVKRKLLPIYRDPDVSISNWLRDKWVTTRQIFIDFAAKSGLKSLRRNE